MIKKAMGGLLERKKYKTGNDVRRDEMDDVLEPEAFEEFDIEDLKPKPKVAD